MNLTSMDVSKAGVLNAPDSQKKAIYEAFRSGDSRFDGQIFVGVTSTGIYCRPVCKAKMPKYENCVFFRTAAEAEKAGFRPCMTCRPELAPGRSLVDARSSLAKRAAYMLQSRCTDFSGIESVAAKLGYTGRHLRRAFEAEYGVTPTQYIRTCRLLLAKSLLTDTDLPVSHVAKASGFGSVRRFNDVFKEHYRLTPTALRKRRNGKPSRVGAVSVRLGYRPPYRFFELLAFLKNHAIEHVEAIDGSSYSRTVRITDQSGKAAIGWIRVEDDPERNQLVLTMSDDLAPVIPEVIGRVRRMFDTDSDPATISRSLISLQEKLPALKVDGIKVPGCFDAFEGACQSLIERHLGIEAARILMGRIVEIHGEKVETGIEGLSRIWPSTTEVRALRPDDAHLGPLGLDRTLADTIKGLAACTDEGKLELDIGANVEEQMDALLGVGEIDPWSARCIAMRTMSYPDALLEGDPSILHAFPDLSQTERISLLEGCRPWCSYAMAALWDFFRSGISIQT